MERHVSLVNPKRTSPAKHPQKANPRRKRKSLVEADIQAAPHITIKATAITTVRTKATLIVTKATTVGMNATNAMKATLMGTKDATKATTLGMKATLMVMM